MKRTLRMGFSIGLLFMVYLALNPTERILSQSAIVSPLASQSSEAHCPLLPDPTNTVVTVTNVQELQAAVQALTSDTTILIADGEYPLNHTLVIDGGVNNIALRGLSGDRQGVVIRGGGMKNGQYGDVPHGILIRNAQDVLIADLTIRDAFYHNIQIQGEQGARHIHLYNLRLFDSGEQLVKGSTAGAPGPYADDGVVACSILAYTDRAPSWYTNGVDVLAGARWVIRDNVFRNIRGPVGELAGPAVLMWRNSLDTIVERNLFLECDRAIALGLSAPNGNSRDGETTYDHQGGIIRNNVIYRAGAGDIGITVNYARNFRIYHNTVILNDTFPWGAIEYRFTASNGEIRNNLTDAPIWQRDGASALLEGNLTTAQPDWFMDPLAGDLHLRSGASQAIDQAIPLADVTDDFDGDPRPNGSAPDIGADEYGEPRPGTVADLRVVQAITTTGHLTVTLNWSPPTHAVTTTLRYHPEPISASNWEITDPLAAYLPGNTQTVTAIIPLESGRVYFALKSQNQTGIWSELSNNAFWPAEDQYLPTIPIRSFSK